VGRGRGFLLSKEVRMSTYCTNSGKIILGTGKFLLDIWANAWYIGYIRRNLL
jgi:hypothetical protein